MCVCVCRSLCWCVRACLYASIYIYISVPYHYYTYLTGPDAGQGLLTSPDRQEIYSRSSQSLQCAAHPPTRVSVSSCHPAPVTITGTTIVVLVLLPGTLTPEVSEAVRSTGSLRVQLHEVTKSAGFTDKRAFSRNGVFVATCGCAFQTLGALRLSVALRQRSPSVAQEGCSGNSSR